MDGSILEAKRAYSRLHANKHAAKNRAAHTSEWYESVGNRQHATCPRCGLSGSVLDNFFKNSSFKTGFQASCKQCHLDLNKNRKFLRTYGLTIEGRRALWVERGKECEICHMHLANKFNVDHCHVSGKVRGILCNECNRGIGLYHDSPDRLRAAAAYLERSK